LPVVKTIVPTEKTAKNYKYKDNRNSIF